MTTEVAGQRQSPTTTNPPVRVLIVDDTAAVRFLLGKTLSMSVQLVAVGEAVDGRDGIEQATRLQPDIILLDLAMPVMDGLEAIPHLVLCSPQAVIIMLSGFDAEATAPGAMALGAHGFVEKKLPPVEMLLRIAEVWESASQR